jgi:hypothetical protein
MHPPPPNLSVRRFIEKRYTCAFERRKMSWIRKIITYGYDTVTDTTINVAQSGDITFVHVCQWLATGLWFSRGIPVSSTNKTDSHDIAEILLKVAFSIINLNQTTFKLGYDLWLLLSSLCWQLDEEHQ